MNTIKDEIRKVLAWSSLGVALAMFVLVLAIAVPGNSEMSIREAVLVGLCTGIPAATAFYLSIGREAVGGLPVALVIAIGYSAAAAVAFFSTIWGAVIFVVASVLCIPVQLLCNHLDENIRRR